MAEGSEEDWKLSPVFFHLLHRFVTRWHRRAAETRSGYATQQLWTPEQRQEGETGGVRGGGVLMQLSTNTATKLMVDRVARDRFN